MFSPVAEVRPTVYWLELVPAPVAVTARAIRSWRRSLNGRKAVKDPELREALSLLSMYYGLAGPQRSRPYTVGGRLVLIRRKADAEAMAKAVGERYARMRGGTTCIVRRGGVLANLDVWLRQPQSVPVV